MIEHEPTSFANAFYRQWEASCTTEMKASYILYLLALSRDMDIILSLYLKSFCMILRRKVNQRTRDTKNQSDDERHTAC